MKRFAELSIETNVVRYIHVVDEKPVFHPSITLIDITGNLDVEEGYFYDENLDVFTAPLNTPLQDGAEISKVNFEELQLQILLNTEMLLIYKEMGI